MQTGISSHLLPTTTSVFNWQVLTSMVLRKKPFRTYYVQIFTTGATGSK